MSYVYFVPSKRLFPACFQEEFLGLELLRVELPRRRGAVRRILRRLERAGVTRALNLPTLPRYPEPCPRAVATAPLYHHRAAELALWDMHRRGLTPERSVVALRGRSWTAVIARAADALAPRVKGLSLCLDRPEAERAAAAALLERWGVGVLHGEGDVTLCFTPADSAGGRLLLGEDRPTVEGLAWRWQGGALPEGVPADALLTVLEQRGRVDWAEILPESRAESEQITGN